MRKSGTPGGLQEVRIDVRRVDEEVRPEEFLHLGGAELGEIFGQFLLGVAPGEVGVGLREADLGEPVHHLRPRERLGEEDHVRMARAHVGDHPLPERQRLGVRIVDAEDAHAFAGPIEHDVAQRGPQSRRAFAVEIDVDDVLIFLRRVLGVFDRAVRPPLEPVRMILQPRMIGRALDREVERDLQPVLARRRDEAAEVGERAELRMDRVVPAFVAADRIGAAGIVRRGGERVVAALAVLFPDRMDRREIKNVEAHLPDLGQAADHVVERAVAVRVAGLRARKQLVPACELGLRPLDVERTAAHAARGTRARRTRRRLSRSQARSAHAGWPRHRRLAACRSPCPAPWCCRAPLSR